MKTIGEILKKNNSSLSKLIGKSQRTRDLASVFQSMLDADLAKNCKFANLDDSVITITVKNAAWATRIRFAIPDLLKNLRTQPEFKKVTNIRYLVNHHQINNKQDQNKKKPKKARLSVDNEILWQETLSRLKKNRESRALIKA